MEKSNPSREREREREIKEKMPLIVDTVVPCSAHKRLGPKDNTIL